MYEEEAPRAPRLMIPPLPFVPRTPQPPPPPGRSPLPNVPKTPQPGPSPGPSPHPLVPKPSSPEGAPLHFSKPPLFPHYQGCIWSRFGCLCKLYSFCKGGNTRQKIPKLLHRWPCRTYVIIVTENAWACVDCMQDRRCSGSLVPHIVVKSDTEVLRIGGLACKPSR